MTILYLKHHNLVLYAKHFGQQVDHWYSFTFFVCSIVFVNIYPLGTGAIFTQNRFLMITEKNRSSAVRCQHGRLEQIILQEMSQEDVSVILRY